MHGSLGNALAKKSLRSLFGKVFKKNPLAIPSKIHGESGKSKWGLSKWGLKVLFHNCPRLPTIVVISRRKLPLERGPKSRQKCRIVDDCAQIAESGLKPPFESPHLDFPERRRPPKKAAKKAAEKIRQKSGTDMTGRPGDRTMEMNGGSTASRLARTLRVPFLCLF